MRIVTTAASLALLLPGIVLIVSHSQGLLQAKTIAVSEGRDQFYTFSRELEPTGDIVRAVTFTLKTAPTGSTMVVFPEGVMVNYLARFASPLPTYFFLSTDGQLVQRLRANPPDLVVLISRDLREYGVAGWGEKAGAGKEILDWLAADYRPAATVGGDPLDAKQRGAVLFRRGRPADSQVSANLQ